MARRFRSGAFSLSHQYAILDDLVGALKPVSIIVEGDFSVRGGIASLVRASFQKPRGRKRSRA